MQEATIQGGVSLCQWSLVESDGIMIPLLKTAWEEG